MGHAEQLSDATLRAVEALRGLDDAAALFALREAEGAGEGEVVFAATLPESGLSKVVVKGARAALHRLKTRGYVAPMLGRVGTLYGAATAGGVVDEGQDPLTAQGFITGYDGEGKRVFGFVLRRPRGAEVAGDAGGYEAFSWVGSDLLFGAPPYVDEVNAVTARVLVERMRSRKGELLLQAPSALVATEMMTLVGRFEAAGVALPVGLSPFLPRIRALAERAFEPWGLPGPSDEVALQPSRLSARSDELMGHKAFSTWAIYPGEGELARYVERLREVVSSVVTVSEQQRRVALSGAMERVTREYFSDDAAGREGREVDRVERIAGRLIEMGRMFFAAGEERLSRMCVATAAALSDPTSDKAEIGLCRAMTERLFFGGPMAEVPMGMGVAASAEGGAGAAHAGAGAGVGAMGEGGREGGREGAKPEGPLLVDASGRAVSSSAVSSSAVSSGAVGAAGASGSPLIIAGR